MTVSIICVGKLKEKYLVDAISEYSKRISPYGRLEIIELAESRLGSTPSDAEILASVEREGVSILEKIPPRAFVLGLFIEGRSLSSEEFSDLLQNEMQRSSEFVFIIGGSNGLSEAVSRRCSFKLSFSKMTFPHQLMRVFLLEQIYRAFAIMSGSKYHK